MILSKTPDHFPRHKYGALLLHATMLVMFIASCNSERHEDSGPAEDLTFATSRFVKGDPTMAYLTPDESLKSFRLPKGYHMELVADETMLNEPVAITWDGNGRMFVAQMETYMQTIDTTGQRANRSRVLLLEDTDDDGKMDKRSVFIDSLMLPRMLLSIGNELLVNETDSYNIYAYKDTDNDGKADRKRIVFQSDRNGSGNLEHQRSGLDWNIDNYIYVTIDPVRFRYTKDGLLEADTLIAGANGQWGVTHDNYGRLYFSRAGGEVPACGFHINPSYGRLEFADAYVDSVFGQVWPIVVTPDVQAGPRRLRPDTTLNHFTSGSGQAIFRGDKLPKSFVGDYVINEPVGRIVRRARITNTNGKRTLENVYDENEFISSTDMNFRPVNLYTGPDGCLYVVDMNRGIIQEGTWVEEGSYLREQILKLGLDKNIQRGRIWRVVHDDYKRGPQPRMLNETSKELVKHLAHPNGWWRDMAQRELVIRQDKSVVEDLKEIARRNRGPLNEKPNSLARLHALWTLSGLQSLDEDLLIDAFEDDDAQVRKGAIWMSEEFLANGNDRILSALSDLKNDSDSDVRVQLLLSLSKSNKAEGKSLSDDLLAHNQGSQMIVEAHKSLLKTNDIKVMGARLGALSPEDRSLISDGSAIFNSICSTCHGPEGKGLPTQLAPPLYGQFSRYWSNKDALVRILLHGLKGPVNGKTYNENMISMAANDDKWIASVLSYIRYDLGLSENPNQGPPSESFARYLLVTPNEVKKLREEGKQRTTPWTWEELDKLK